MKFLYRVYPLLAVPNCVQDGTRYRPNGAAETLRNKQERKSHVVLYTDAYFHHTRESLILSAYLHRQQPCLFFFSQS